MRLGSKVRLFGLSLIFLFVISLASLSMTSANNSDPDVIFYDTNDFIDRIQPNEECLVDCSDIVSGGPPKDGIPSIDSPNYYSTDDADSVLDDSDRVIGVEINGVMHGYPHEILDYHEIVNHNINGAILSITYCPLTGTGIPFRPGGEIGTSGKLYENNLVFYDRDTDSLWAQMYGLAIKGERIGETLEFGQVVEAKWSAFKQLYPDANILNRDTGYDRDYDRYPYDVYSYKTSRTILFESSYNEGRPPDNSYHPKALTLVIEDNGHWGLFPYEELNGQSPQQVIHENRTVAVFYDESGELAVPFDYTLDETELTFTRTSGDPISDALDFGLTVYQDQLGNIWNMKGVAIAGPNEGARLDRIISSYTAFWFSTMALYDTFSIYTQTDTFTVSDTPRTGSTHSRLIDATPSLAFLSLIVIPYLRRRKRAI